MIDHGLGVELGPMDRSHLEQCRKWRNMYSIFRWCRQNDVISDADQEHWFERQRQDPSIRMYMILDKEKKPVGVCGLTSIDPFNRRAEFSLYVGPEHWGSGYGRKGLQTLLTHAFKTLGLNSVWGETFQGNPAAGMFKEIGMKHEGTRRAFYFREGKFNDCDLYSVLASEWNGGVSAASGAREAPERAQI